MTALPRLQPGEGGSCWEEGRVGKEGEMIRGWGLDSDKPRRLVD